MNDKQEFDASDIKWENINFYRPWADHAVIYNDPNPPQRFQKLNPFAWIKYWKKKRHNLIAYLDLHKSEGNAEIHANEDGSITITWKYDIE